MPAPSSGARAAVPRHELRAGPMLAEGGEGRVYELADQPGMLYKAYRRPVPLDPLAALLAWQEDLAGTGPELAARVRSSAGWPTAVVTEPGAPPGTAAGLLLPRAPRRFSVRHRDGMTRLATLSYLTTDPGQRAAAYGLALPGPMSAERIGIVYALARLLEAFQSASPSVGHGDLSAKNVLWSLERGPEVFVLDCDSCERYADDGSPLDAGHRRRAMTPNWDDPAIPAGANPTVTSDRYSLALIFLRVAGAAHFPLQSRQRQGETVGIDFELPPPARRAPSLADGAPIWDVCSRSLGGARPSDRPGASQWVAALEEVLGDLGAAPLVRATWSAQGGGAASAPPPAATRWAGDVTVRPVAAPARDRRWERHRAPAEAPTPWRGQRSHPPPAAAPAAPVPSVAAQVRSAAGSGAGAWLDLHRRTAAALSAAGARSGGARLLLVCAALDFVLVAGAMFLVAMLVSPWLGI